MGLIHGGSRYDLYMGRSDKSLPGHLRGHCGKRKGNHLGKLEEVRLQKDLQEMRLRSPASAAVLTHGGHVGLVTDVCKVALRLSKHNAVSVA